MKKLEYSYSQLSTSAVSQSIALQYDMPEITDCKFYVLGLHDNYLIVSNKNKYILRVYRNDWRSDKEIQFELELLAYLGERNAPVATPILTKSDGLSFTIDSPEGKRKVALFHYADGYAPGKDITIEQSNLLGKAVAKVHQITGAFESHLSRQVLSLSYLLDDSIVAIESYLDLTSQRYLNDLKSQLKMALRSHSKKIENYCICIGDVNPTNFHINNKHDITLFDFDQCGYADRCFEIGKFISSIHGTNNKDELSHSFIEGYQTVRQLSPEELAAIPYYEIVSVIWVMAIHAYNANRIGYKYLEKPFWDRRLAILKKLDRKLFKT